MRKRLTPQNYTVGWLCALPESELAAATKMLDHRHEPLPQNVDDDDNTYTYGSINGHNIVIACLPPGQPGKISSQKLVQPLKRSFPNMKIHVFVGIGGGVPRTPLPKNPDEDIRLGDVIVGWAERTGDPAVVQWDYVRDYGDDVQLLGLLEKPHRQLLNALGLVLRDRAVGECNFGKHLEKLSAIERFSSPGFEHDHLYSSDYDHYGQKSTTCENCDPVHLIKRKPRKTNDLVFHQGTILSGDSVMQNARRRDLISHRFYNAMCFEMEAAGVIDDTHCLVIRGIADYADSHKNLGWQCYAAGTAAAFAKELLCNIQPHVVQKMEIPDLEEIIRVGILRSLRSSSSGGGRAGFETMSKLTRDAFSTAMSHIDKGDTFFKRRDLRRRRASALAQDLSHARQCFLIARDVLLSLHGPIDSDAHAKVFFKLMTVEADMSYNRTLSAEEMKLHLVRAREYGVQATVAVQMTGNPGMLIQVQFEQAMLDGRCAELQAKSGASVQEVRSIKDAAIQAMTGALQRLEHCDPTKFHEHRIYAEYWKDRLST